jgi:hypothetical protein
MNFGKSSSKIIIKESISGSKAINEVIKKLNSWEQDAKNLLSERGTFHSLVGETQNTVFNLTETFAAFKSLNTSLQLLVLTVAAVHCAKGTGCWKKMAKAGKTNNLLYKIYEAVKDTHLRPQSFAICAPTTVFLVGKALQLHKIWDKLNYSNFLPGCLHVKIDEEVYAKAMVDHAWITRKTPDDEKEKVKSQVLMYVKMSEEQDDKSDDLQDLIAAGSLDEFIAAMG